jgi:isopentenyl phosphate kinase
VIKLSFSDNAIECSPHRIDMDDCIVIKFGGGLITDKSMMCTPNHAVIDSLVNVVRDCLEDNLRVIVVHGAGSFGHLRSKHWKLNHGYLPDYDFLSQDDCKSQQHAVSLVRKEMLTLNKIVLDAFSKRGIATTKLPPHEWARNTGSNFDGNITKLFNNNKSVEITFGDIVDCDEGVFGILSGDDLVVRICQDIPNVKRLIFAVKGVDGILKRPPELADESDLIEHWSPSTEYSGVHNSEIDVTGGIGLKAIRGSEVAASGVDVFIINGEEPQRLLDACKGISTRGTQIFAE